MLGQQQFGRGALIGMLLLLPALLTFGVDVWLRKRQRDAMSSRAQFYLPKANFQRDTLLSNICDAYLRAVFISIWYGSLLLFYSVLAL